jgi:hypothetical protein
MAEDHSLPGWPKKKLVKDVRRHLSCYGIRPVRLTTWRATWVWAEAIARSYYHTHWPMPTEIATQDILLLLAEKKSNSAVRLPFRANEVVPAQVAALLPSLPTNGVLEITPGPRGQKQRPRPLASNGSPSGPDAQVVP